MPVRRAAAFRDFQQLRVCLNLRALRSHINDVLVIEAGLPETSQPVIARVAMRTDLGAVRKSNEDAAYVDLERRFFVIADGMGGHRAGDVASNMAVNAVREILEAAKGELDTFAAAPSDDGRAWLRALLERAMRVANEDLFERSRRERDKHGMGTTLDVVLVLAGEAFVTHAGDSRTYLVRQGMAIQTTVDHTVAAAMVRAGVMTAEDAEQSPMRSVLSNAVGTSEHVHVDHVHLELEPGDRLLLCSDGLYDYFAPRELVSWVTDVPGDRALAALIAQARARGGRENITGIVVEISSPPGWPAATLDPPPFSLGPLADIDDDALAAFLEHALRESSQPYALPVMPVESPITPVE